MRDEARDDDGREGEGLHEGDERLDGGCEGRGNAEDGASRKRAARGRSEGRFQLRGRFGPSGRRRPKASQRPGLVHLAREEGSGEWRTTRLDPREFYAKETARVGPGLYRCAVIELDPLVARWAEFRRANPRHAEGARCIGLRLESPDGTLHAALTVRMLGRPFHPLAGRRPEAPEGVAGCSWPSLLEAEFGVHALAESLRDAGIGVLVY